MKAEFTLSKEELIDVLKRAGRLMPGARPDELQFFVQYENNGRDLLFEDADFGAERIIVVEK